MEWMNINTDHDVEKLKERVEEFHDWYVAGFSYDPLSQSDSDDLNLGCFKMDTDALTVTFRWDSKSKNGVWPEVQIEFKHILAFKFDNFRDPDPIWNVVIEKAGNWWVFADIDDDTLSEEERAYPADTRSSFLAVCEEMRWRPIAVVTPEGPDWWND